MLIYSGDQVDVPRTHIEAARSAILWPSLSTRGIRRRRTSDGDVGHEMIRATAI